MSKSARRPAATRSKRLPADLTLAVKAAVEKKAIDLVVLDLRGADAFTDFFIICTGANTRQVQTIADAIEDALREHGTKPALIEGHARAHWVLVDYFDFIVHIFSPTTREFYALEKLWGDAKRIEIPT